MRSSLLPDTLLAGARKQASSSDAPRQAVSAPPDLSGQGSPALEAKQPAAPPQGSKREKSHEKRRPAAVEPMASCCCCCLLIWTYARAAGIQAMQGTVQVAANARGGVQAQGPSRPDKKPRGSPESAVRQQTENKELPEASISDRGPKVACPCVCVSPSLMVLLDGATIGVLTCYATNAVHMAIIRAPWLCFLDVLHDECAATLHSRLMQMGCCSRVESPARLRLCNSST